jgi:hypothetical protein
VCFPYVLGLIPNVGVEIRYLFTGQWIQSIDLPKPQIISSIPDQLLIASIHDVWLVLPVDFEDQVSIDWVH